MVKLKKIVSEFRIEGRFTAALPIGSGHINDSYLITTEPHTAPGYVLQRINHSVFRNVPDLTDNILKVTRHLSGKILCAGEKFDFFQVIQLVQTRNGEYYLHDPEGNYWRLYNHIRNSKSYDIVGDPVLAYEGGKAFGIFQYLTSDLNPNILHDILPKFHDISARLTTFRETQQHDPVGRVHEAKEEIGFVMKRADEMHTLQKLGDQGKIPLRVTHNDTKFNNILFNPDNKAISIIDLDTVMPGYILFDFGDAIRSGTNTGTEDEADLRKVNIDLTIFEAYSRGYLEVARDFLSDAEIGLLAFSARFMTYIIGLRFLTDHIGGDHYFKIHFPGHNLQRARAQFKLLRSMEQHFKTMQQIIFKLTSK